MRLISLVAIVALATGVSFSEESIRSQDVVRTIRSPGSRRSQLKVGNRSAADKTIDQLSPLHKRLEAPEPGDWLAEHEETGQTFEKYVSIRPVTPTGRRSTIYVQPLGPFTDDQRKIIGLSAEYLGLYFNRTVKVLEDLPLTVIPGDARRQHPITEVEQVLTTYILQDVLKPRLPDDAATYIAFTASDLWPSEGWNFVYGYAMFRERVGVWSIHRNGDPSENDDAFRLCLLRTLKTAMHEIGHTFSMAHCTAWQCNMNGRNHLEESDRSPLWLCPECHAKIIWATNASARGRFVRLKTFCQEHGLADQMSYFTKAIDIVGSR